MYRANADSECTAQAELADADVSGAMREAVLLFLREREREGLVRGLGCWHGKHRSCHLEGRESSLNPLRGT